jgi:hypothetical protein
LGLGLTICDVTHTLFSKIFDSYRAPDHIATPEVFLSTPSRLVYFTHGRCCSWGEVVGGGGRW